MYNIIHKYEYKTIENRYKDICRTFYSIFLAVFILHTLDFFAY
jgi:hypothetical protein